MPFNFFKKKIPNIPNKSDNEDHYEHIAKKQSILIDKQKKMIRILEHLNSALKDINCIKKEQSEEEQKEIIKEMENIKRNKDYEYLIFSGGSIKGLAYSGAIEVLEKENILYDKNKKLKIKGFAGTSVGSIMATLLAIGYNSRELKQIMINMDTKKVLDDKIGVIRDMINFVKDYGWAPGNYLYEFMGDLIEKKTGNPDYTFEQLYNDKNINLVIVGANMNKKKAIYFYSENKNYKNMPIRKAIRISTCTPFIFEPVELHGNLCVDGGILDNYPIHVFDGDYPGQPEAVLNLCKPNVRVLGLNILTDSSAISYEKNKEIKIDCVAEYAMSFISTFMMVNEKRHMVPSYWTRTINIKTPDYPITKFTLTLKEKNELYEMGIVNTQNFFYF